MAISMVIKVVWLLVCILCGPRYFTNGQDSETQNCETRFTAGVVKCHTETYQIRNIYKKVQNILTGELQSEDNVRDYGKK